MKSSRLIQPKRWRTEFARRPDLTGRRPRNLGSGWDRCNTSSTPEPAPRRPMPPPFRLRRSRWLLRPRSRRLGPTYMQGVPSRRGGRRGEPPGRYPGGRTTVVRPTAATPPRGPRATAPPRRTTTTGSTLVETRFCSFEPGIGPLSALAGALTVASARTTAATEPLMTPPYS